ncbi:MAG TPA: DUF6152 family protein [Caulobacteraceae bacterium]
MRKRPGTTLARRILAGPILAGASLAFALAAPALAHHSYAMFDAQQNKQLEGTVEAFKWSNPHSYIEVLVMDDKGQTQKWTAECGSPAQMVKAGWRSTSLKPGDHVVVTVHPLRSGEFGGSFVQVQTADGHVLKAS